MSFPDLLEDMRRRREEILAGGGAEKLAQRRAKGLMSARERLDALFDEATFQEMGGHVRHSARNFGMETKVLPADGVVVGTGYVGGRMVSAYAQDFTVLGGSLGKMHAKKIVTMMEEAAKFGSPVVAFKDSAGARIQEALTRSRVTAACSTRTCCCPEWCRRSRWSAAHVRAAPPIRRR